MSEQTATSVRTSQQQAQPEGNNDPVVQNATATSDRPAVAAVSPALVRDVQKQPVIEIPDSPPRASTSTPRSLAPSGQRALPSFQQPVRPGQYELQAVGTPQALGPQQPQHQHYGQQAVWPQPPNGCPRCGFVFGQQQYGQAPQQQRQQHFPPQQAPPTYHMPNRVDQRPQNYPAITGPPPSSHPNAHLYVPNGIPDNSPLQRPQPARPPEISPTNPPSPKEPTSFLGYGAASIAVPPTETVIGADGTIHHPRRRGPRTKRRRLTRDERRDVLLMRRLGYSYDVIARFLGTTISAVSYTCKQGTPDTKHHMAGRRTNKLPPELVENMVRYVGDYLAKERAAGFDKKTGKKKMTPLTYIMIRDALFKDENGNIPPELKITDDGLKQILNKKGLWLRTPYSQAKIEEARARGKKQWLDKCAREAAEKARAEAAARGQTITEDQLAAAREHGAREGEESHGYVEAQANAEAEVEAEDQEMQEASSGTDSAAEDDEHLEHDHDMETQLRRAIQIHPLQHA